MAGRSLLRVLTVVCFAIVTLGAAPIPPAPRVWLPDVVWNPSAAAQRKVDACSTQDCLLEIMRTDGASWNAVRFAQTLGDLFNDVAYATRYRDAGALAVVDAVLPLQMNENETAYIVNGRESNIDKVDDWRAIERLDLAKDPNFYRIRMKYPRAEIWLPAKFDHVERDKYGEYVLIFNATIRNGGRAGAIVGRARLAYIYSSASVYQGVWLRSTIPL